METITTDSEFLSAAMDEMGSPDRWCKDALVLPRSLVRELTWNGQTIIEAFTTDNALLDKPELITSVCLEGAIQLTERKCYAQAFAGAQFDQGRLMRWQMGVWIALGGDDEQPVKQSNRVRKELMATLVEQYPDIVAHYRAEHERLQKTLGKRNADFDPNNLSLPGFNDHDAFTYEGMRTVCEKTLARLRDAGR